MTMNLMNAVRTDNMILDMILGVVLCMLIPVIIELISTHGKICLSTWSHHLRGLLRMLMVGYEGAVDENCELQKALLMYIH